MPFRSTATIRCVFYALVFALSCEGTLSAQMYSKHADGGRQSFSGIVDRLTDNDPEPNRMRPVDTKRYSQAERSDPRTESRLRPVGDEAVTLRPQPMSVRQTSYDAPSLDTAIAEQSDESERQARGRLHAQEHLQSFIEREAAAEPAKEKINPSDMISRIGVNLIFVLALAIGGILLVKYLQKGKLSRAPETPAGLSGLKIDQVLQVSRGVSLYLIDSAAAKVLVAVDASGIKSVNVLPGRFEDALEEPEAFGRVEKPVAPEPAPRKERLKTSRRRIDETSSSDIDQNLIKLLLNKSKQAA